MTKAQRRHDSDTGTTPVTQKSRRSPNPLGRVRQLPSKRWQASYLTTTGQRVTAPATFDTRRDAEAWLKAQKPGDYRDPKAGRVTFGAYSQRWMAERELKPRTRADYQRILDRFLVPTFGATPLEAITPAIVKSWHASLDKSRPTMRAHTYALLRTITKGAVADDLITASPCRVRGAGQTKREKEIRPATMDELAAITAAMPARLKALVQLAAWCGLRYGELVELRRKDIDLVHRKIRVRRGVTRVAGQWVVGDPKSSAGKRDVSLPPHLVPIVTSHLDEHTGPAASALLFPGAQGGYLSPASLYDHFYPARQAAGRPDLRFHDLRHTGAVYAAVAGATLAELMARLGHSTQGAAMRYQHAAEDRDAALADALSAMYEAQVVPLRPRAAR